MTEKILGGIIIGIVGCLLTFARRYKNKDKEAGAAIAGWTLVIVALWMLDWLRRKIMFEYWLGNYG